MRRPPPPSSAWWAPAEGRAAEGWHSSQARAAVPSPPPPPSTPFNTPYAKQPRCWIFRNTLRPIGAVGKVNNSGRTASIPSRLAAGVPAPCKPTAHACAMQTPESVHIWAECELCDRPEVCKETDGRAHSHQVLP